MVKKVIPACVLFSLIFLINNKCASETYIWRRMGISAETIGANCAAVDKKDHAVMYVGFKDAIFISRDSGLSWQAKFLSCGDVHFILIDEKDNNKVYAACSQGCYVSKDKGENWKKIFSGKDELERDVFGICIIYNEPKELFIATRGGLFASPASHIFWRKKGGELEDAAIKFLTTEDSSAEVLYIVSNKGLFRSKDRLISIEKIYKGTIQEIEDIQTDIESEEETVVVDEFYLRHLAINPLDKKRLYLGTINGLLQSKDAGKTWHSDNNYGLLHRKINYILPLGEKRFFAAAENGVFECSEEGACLAHYKGMIFKNSSQLVFTDRLLAATDEGLFVLDRQESFSLPAKNESAYSEPDISFVQGAAIRYAEVFPEKIANWRWQARMKAFLPEVTLDYDKTVATSIAANYEKSIVGPRDWGVSFSWDLADVVFSTDQTSIDVRSRLMVQLRDDVLDEVNRLFFERKRLLSELRRREPLSAKQKEEKELRIEELTASLDGLTGGYFSRNRGGIREGI